VAAQEGLTRCRKELEETRKREVRLREKLRDQLDGDGKRLGRKGEDTADRYDQLERELELLRTQNLILRKGTAGGSIEEKEGETDLQLGKESMKDTYSMP
jgi:cell wall assembly regulator SMI1